MHPTSFVVRLPPTCTCELEECTLGCVLLDTHMYPGSHTLEHVLGHALHTHRNTILLLCTHTLLYTSCDAFQHACTDTHSGTNIGSWLLHCLHLWQEINLQFSNLNLLSL